MNWLVVVPTVAAKFLLPVALIWFPFAAGWANFVLDSVDGDILVPAGYGDNPVAEANDLYQTTDKVADFVTYVFMVVAAWKWPVRRLIVALFALRAIGQVLYFITRSELVFVLFPNFLEPLFLVCATILRLRRVNPWEHLAQHRWLYGALIFVYKMQDEVFTHLLNIDRTDTLRRLFGG